MPLLTEESPLAEQPPGVGVELKRHQRAALHACMRLETESVPLSEIPELRRGGACHPADALRTKVGVLGDRVGAGKSFVLLGLLAATKGKAFEPGPAVRTYGGGRVVVTMRETTRSIGTTLLVIPHNLCGQWESYVASFFPRGSGVSSVCVSRTKHLQALRAALDREEGVDIIIVINTFYCHVANVLNDRRVRVRRMLVDEADTISLPGNLIVDAAFYWFVTASYASMFENGHHMYNGRGSRTRAWLVRSVFADFTTLSSRDVAQAIVVRSDDAFVRSSMCVPDPETARVLCRAPWPLRVLKGVADRYIIDCLNAGDVPAAIQHINPCNRDTEANIVSVLVDKYVKEARNVDLQIACAKQFEYNAPEERDVELQRLERRRCELDANVSNIRARIAGTGACCICYEPIVRHKSMTPCCSNAFCFACIGRWVTHPPGGGGSSTCPLCKTALTSTDLLVVVTEEEEEDGSSGSGPSRAQAKDAQAEGGQAKDAQAKDAQAKDAQAKDKLGMLEDILRDRCAPQRGAKVLIFSTHDHPFKEITEVLDRLRISFRLLRGNHFVVNKIVDEYKTGALDVLLVNTAHYGCGLNLENTSDIIMYHRVRPDVENQIVGRAMRMGRADQLKIWHMLYENETV